MKLTTHLHLVTRVPPLVTDKPIYGRCLNKGQGFSRILYYYEAFAYVRFYHLGHYVTDPRPSPPFLHATLAKVLHFVTDVGLLLG
jgi:hypothetical protein